jgi:hypothetical protein
MLTIVAGLSATIPTSANAGDTTFLNGNQLFDDCNSPDNMAGICAGFLMAIADAMQRNNIVVGWRACIPDGVIGKQLL